jgi:chaperonin GroES
VATGPGTYDNTGNLIPTRVAEGDHVLLPNYGGTTFEMAEEKYHIFRDTEILGKVEL